jgi:hypothetical protein
MEFKAETQSKSRQKLSPLYRVRIGGNRNFQMNSVLSCLSPSSKLMDLYKETWESNSVSSVLVPGLNDSITSYTQFQILLNDEGGDSE